MDTQAIPKKRPIEEWCKILDQTEQAHILEWAVSNPGVVSKPYTKEISEGEFIQLLLHIVCLYSKKITFTETPLHNWDEIAEFIGTTIRRSKTMTRDFGAPIAMLSGFPFTTKERLSVWMNDVITTYPYFKEDRSVLKKKRQDVFDLRIAEAQRLKKKIINKFREEYPIELLHFIDNYIERIEKKKEREMDKTVKGKEEE